MENNTKTVWITGASSGIGEALAYAFSELSYHVILSARRPKELQRVKDNCSKNAAGVSIVPLDLANHSEIEQIAQAVIEEHQRVDVLINNGGISQRSRVLETSIETEKRIMDVNFFGTIVLTKSVLPYMVAQKSGHIIVISSLTGKFGTALRSSYAASKHALHGYFDSLRSEVWTDNVKVLLVCPGFVKTQISINALLGDGQKQNQMDTGQANGMLPQQVAQKIIRAMRKNKEEIVVGRGEVIGVYLKRFFPKIFSNMIKKRDVRG